MTKRAAKMAGVGVEACLGLRSTSAGSEEHNIRHDHGDTICSQTSREYPN
jgi:hypothetical protein